ncbi:MAG: oligosaccharide flippase family protein [Planctomycetes bacterium]|nr:oligosaccharide flippase family protein [Planctomycetota bacterium]MBI3846257.1 oligosaccharide flippase family protein [Planctomycetota bacterium]
MTSENAGRPQRLGVRLARNAALTFGAGCVAALAQAAGSIATARLLGPEAYGRLGLLLWLISVASILGAMGLPLTVTQSLAEARSKGDSARSTAIVRRAIRIVALASTGVTVAAVFLAPLAASWFRDPDIVAPARVAAAAVPAISLVLLLRAALAGLDRYPALTRATTWLAPIQLALVVLGAASGLGASGALAGFAASQVIGVCILFAARDPQPESAFREPVATALGRDVRRFASIVVGIAMLDAIVWQRSELFFLGRFGSHAELAHYSVAFGFSSAAMALVPGAFAAVLLPMFAETAGRSDEVERRGRLYAASLRALAMIAVPLAAGGAALASPIVLVLFGQPYAQAATPLAIVLFGAAAGAIGSAGSSLLYGSGRHSAILAMSGATAVLNVGLDLLLIPSGGAIGAAMANTTSQVIAVGAGILWVKRTQARGVSLPLASLARIVLAAGAMAAPLVLLAPAIRNAATLALAIALGAVLYVTTMIFIRGVDSADIDLARRIGERIPSGRGLRWFGACIDALERAVERGSPHGRI